MYIALESMEPQPPESHVSNAKPQKNSRTFSNEGILGVATLGCFVTGSVGLFRGAVSDDVLGAGICLLSAVAAFAAVGHFWLRDK